MDKRPKIGKISVTVFLTALIWVWADLAQDERLDLSNFVTVTVAKPSDPNLWVALENEDSSPRASLTIDRVVLKGPASRVSEIVRRKNREKLDLNLFLVPEQMGLTETTTLSTLDVLSFLKEADEIRRLGLTVETCEPRNIAVRVARLRTEPMAVECVDEMGNQIVTEAIEPSLVKARVLPEGIAAARVRLTAEEQRQAREAPVEKTPYVELPDGQRRDALQPVKVKLPPAENALRQYPVSGTLGLCMSRNLQGKYKVELREDPMADLVLVRATAAAHQAYDKMPFHMLLYIEDSDKPSQEYTSREVVFNFPQEYMQRGEITLDQSVPKVQFRLIPIGEQPPGPAGM
ncbi:MAG: hypothetical protein JW955_03125 [Sedimentisphaerales bacterium]|nr:hypothetical protein [Sedimentisphaerales bacterium]